MSEFSGPRTKAIASVLGCFEELYNLRDSFYRNNEEPRLLHDLEDTLSDLEIILRILRSTQPEESK